MGIVTACSIAVLSLVYGCLLLFSSEKSGRNLVAGIALLVASLLSWIDFGFKLGQGSPRNTYYLECNGIYQTIGSIKSGNELICLIEDREGNRILYQFTDEPPRVFKVIDNGDNRNFVAFPESP